MYFSKLKRQTIISLSLFFSSLLSVQALSLIQQSQDELIRSADLIVHTTVMKTETHSGGSQQFAYSISTLRVHSALKGQSSHTLYVYQSGGVFKGLSQHIIGQELLKEGQEWTLFLAPMPKNERTEQIFKTHPKYETLYRLISGPLASQQVFTDKQGHKSVKLGTNSTKNRQGVSTGTHGTQQEKAKPSLKVVKVKTRPKLQLKAPIFKLKPSTKAHSEASPKARSKTQPKTQPKKQVQIKSKAFKLYIDELKTAIDRSLAPKIPTH